MPSSYPKFYQLKRENMVAPIQQDGYNCGLGTTLAIMRFKKAFQNINISRDWIDTKEQISSAIIPESIFCSIKYNVSDEKYLQYV